MPTQIETMAAETAALAAAAAGPKARLVVQPSEGDPRTRVVQLPTDAEVTFGRSRGATVFIDSESVSRLHARLAWREGQLVIEDLGSRNGTRVNGQRITGATAVNSGDEIAIGPATALVSLSSATGRRMRRSRSRARAPAVRRRPAGSSCRRAPTPCACTTPSPGSRGPFT